MSSSKFDADTDLDQGTKQCETIQSKCAEKLRIIAKGLRDQQKTVNITKVTNSSVGAGAGIVGVGALILAPFTLGATLPVAAVAGGVGVASVAVDIGASIAESKIIRSKMEEAHEILNELQSATEDLLTMLEAMLKAKGFSTENITLFLKGGAVQFKIGALALNIRKALKVAKATTSAGKIAATLGGGSYVAKAVVAADVAGTAAAAKAGFKALKPAGKIFKVGGPILGAVGVGFTIYDIVDSSIKIHGGVSEGADVIEKIAKALSEK